MQGSRVSRGRTHPGRASPGARHLARRTLSVLAWIAIGLGFLGPAARAEAAPSARHLSVPPGYAVNLYAKGLGRARLMVLTPTGDIILSSPRNRVLLIEADRNGDGRADGVRVLIGRLRRPHGLWLDTDTGSGDVADPGRKGMAWLYIAEEARVVRVRFDIAKGRRVGKLETVLTGLPDDGGHWTRTLKRGPDGWFYLTVGSSCNVCVEAHPWRATMLRFRPDGDPKNRKVEIHARGLRNTVGFDWRPGTGALYGVDNGRDWLGDDFPPDELNRITAGGFYGWPYFNGANVPDPDLGGLGGDEARDPIPPAFAFPAHVAPLSIRFLRHQGNPRYRNAALVGEHGSWNRSEKIGYQVVSLHWNGKGAITRRPFLTGFLRRGKVSGRPVDVIEAPDGTIFVSDDFAGAIWRIVPRARP